MITQRPAQARGKAHHGWLESWHSFSFADYYDPQYMGFASLRVINEDIVAPGKGFATHGHRDMEIVTYVLEGALAHKDSIGNGAVMHPGDVQRMTAGTGILHSEFNASDTEPVHLLQIWLLPDTMDLPPSYEQIHFPEAEKQGQLRLIGSRDGREGSVTIHQDVNLYAAKLEMGEMILHPVNEHRQLWLQVARGEVLLNDQHFGTGDGAAIVQDRSGSAAKTTELTLVGQANGTELLLFDMAA